MTFKETWAELESLQEWKYLNPPQSTGKILDPKSQPENTTKQYKVSYTEDGVQKSFIVVADSKSEAIALAWERVDADDVYVDEV